MTWFYILVGFVVIFILSRTNPKTNQINKKQRSSNNSNQIEAPVKTNYKKRFKEIESFINNEEIVFLDTETTGLNDTDQIIEIAILNLNGDILLNTLVKPTIKINKSATNIHGITDKMVKNAPTWKQVYPQYLELTDGKTILAYNSGYDKKMVQQTCKANKLVNKRRQWDCIMMAYSTFMGKQSKYSGYKRYKLTDAGKNSGVSITNMKTQEHRALYDTGLSLGVFLYMKKRVNESQID